MHARNCPTCGTYVVRSKKHSPEVCTAAVWIRRLRALGWYVCPRRHLATFDRLGLLVVYPTGTRGQPQRWAPIKAIDAADAAKLTEGEVRAYQNFPRPSSEEKKSA